MSCHELTLTPRQLCDLEMIVNGGFHPLTGFLTQQDYDSVVTTMRLTSGQLWPIPITLDVDNITAFTIGDKITLKDSFNHPLATLTLASIWQPDKAKEAYHVFGSADDTCHPAIDYLLNTAGKYYLGGPIDRLSDPRHYDFNEYRRTPAQLKAYFKEHGINKIVGFQTRNPMHRSHYELTRLAQAESDAHVLIHPVVGMTKPGDVDYFTRVKCYKQLISYYDDGSATLSLLPLAMRMAGPREALWHALIRKNYGCTHFVIGRDHAGPGNNKDGQPFYDPYAAQKLVRQHEDEVGLTMLTYQMVVYVEDLSGYRQIHQVPKDMKIRTISGTQLRQLLYSGQEIPSWFTFAEIARILKQRYPPTGKQGFTLFFTGLSGAGKSTLAQAVQQKLLEVSYKPVTILDGDQVRQHLSKGLTFSKEDRNANVERIGYVASLITKSGGIAIAAAIAPYQEARQTCRSLVEEFGGFFEIHVNTPLSTCEERDTKGLYAKARQGMIKNFTGISDPYHVPVQPEVTINTEETSIGEAVTEIVSAVREYIG